MKNKYSEKKSVSGNYCCFSLSMAKTIILFAVFSLFTFESFATHFRYANISWTRAGSQVTFKINASYNYKNSSGTSLNYYTFSSGAIPAVGATVVRTGSAPTENFNFGDATAQVTIFPLTITQVNVTEGWWTGTTNIVHTYASLVGTRLAFLVGSGARDLDLGNNAGLGPYRVETVVNFVNANANSLLPNNSPVSTLPSVVNVPINLVAAQFQIPVIEPDGNPFSFAISTPAQMGNASATQPPGFSLNPATGVVTFNTVGKILNTEYSASVRVIDSAGAVTTLDFLMKIVAQSTPPAFVYPPTPANASTFTIQWGTPLTFSVRATDVDPIDIVELTAAGLPVGSIMTPGLPTSGNPVNATFSWTPTQSSIGGHVINFTAEDGFGVQTNSTVNILVTGDPEFDVPPTPASGSSTCYTPGSSITNLIQAHAPDPSVNVQLTAATIPSGATLSPALPTPAGNTTATNFNWTPAASDWGVHSLSFTATDATFHATTHSYNLIVNTTPTFVNYGNISVCSDNTLTLSFYASDPDLAYGDVLTFSSTSLPSWLTLSQSNPDYCTLTGVATNAQAGVHSITLLVSDTYNSCHAPVSITFSITVYTSVDDNDLCTIDGCNPNTGPVYTNVNYDDQDACTIDACDPLTGVSHTTVNPDDNNLCTNDFCDPSSGVYHTDVNYDDQDACTIDACDPLTGISHTPVNPNDHNVCTDDYCDPSTGVYHVDIIIDDQNVCTTDACDPVAGISHTTIDFNDQNGCTTDACDPILGVSHTPVSIDDSNPCTIDACNPSTGDISHTDNSPVISATVGTIACYNGSANIIISATGGQSPYTGTGSFSQSAGTVSYPVMDANGCLVFSNPITLIQPPKLSATATSTPSSCAGNDGTSTVLPTGGTPGYSYSWMPGGQSTSTINGLTPGIYNVIVTDSRGCTFSAVTSVSSGGTIPPAPSIINGAGGACRGGCSVFTIDPIPGAVSYEWLLPTGATGSSSGTSITICFNTKFIGGFICARALNQCGAGAWGCKGVVLYTSRPAKPGAIYTFSNVCSAGIQTFCIPTVLNADSYLWTIEGVGANPITIVSGQGSPCVDVNVPVGYNNIQKLRVVAVNCKGISDYVRTDVKVLSLLAMPGAISGPTSVCKSQTKSYSITAITGATSYFWSVTGGATITSGQGTRSISVKYTTATTTAAVLSVSAVNPCGNSPARNLNIAVSLTCKTSANEEMTEENLNVDIASLSVYPNPTHGQVSIEFNSDQSAEYMIKIINISGQVIVAENFHATEGINKTDIDLTMFSKGLYFLNIIGNDGASKTVKVIIE